MSPGLFPSQMLKIENTVFTSDRLVKNPPDTLRGGPTAARLPRNWNHRITGVRVFHANPCSWGSAVSHPPPPFRCCAVDLRRTMRSVQCASPLCELDANNGCPPCRHILSFPRHPRPYSRRRNHCKDSEDDGDGRSDRDAEGGRGLALDIFFDW